MLFCSAKQSYSMGNRPQWLHVLASEPYQSAPINRRTTPTRSVGQQRFRTPAASCRHGSAAAQGTEPCNPDLISVLRRRATANSSDNAGNLLRTCSRCFVPTGGDKIDPSYTVSLCVRLPKIGKPIYEWHTMRLCLHVHCTLCTSNT